MKNRFIASFDTEDDGKGNPYLWCIVHGKGSWTGYSRESTLEYILTLARDLKLSDTVLELWATNLEYDLVNLFGPERIAELSLRFGKSYLVGASWKGHNTDFRDTVRHIPMSVKQLGELVGMPKLTMSKNQKMNEAYCLRDAAITRRTAVWLNDLYKSFNIAPKMTLASSAMAIWRDNYWQREVKLPPKEILTHAKEAYYGGRTEAFGIGTFKDVVALDVASMFPWAMIADKFPIPWGEFRRWGKDDSISPYGIYHCNVRSKILTPFLPVRTIKGTQYPNGVFTGWYCGIEILYALNSGYSIEVTKGYEFLEYADPFKGYVNAFFAMKNEAKGPARMGYKLLLNSLYGKFGQTGDKVMAIPIEEFVKKKNPPLSYRIWNGIVIYPVKGNPPPWGNNLWSALITARARVRLAHEMEALTNKGARVLYCDTDSIIFNGYAGNEYPEKASKAGEFELRGRYAEMFIAGKKEYGLRETTRSGWETHVKGVPANFREKYLFEGNAQYQAPVRLKEAARRGLQANVWVDKEKVRKVNFKERIKRADNTFKPLVIDTRGKGQAQKKRGRKNGNRKN